MIIRHRSSRGHYHPDLFDWATERHQFPVDLRVDRLARRCRVSRAMAAMIAENAGLLKGDR
jgi:hypothetical protein